MGSNYDVTNSNDSGEGSLRKAIALANENPGKDTVFVQTDDVQLNSAIDISDDVEIGTPYGAKIEQTQSDRLFNIDDGTEKDINVSLFRLTLSGGESNSPGGAIYSSENLTIADSKLQNNSAIDRGGAIHHRDGILDISRTEIVDNLVLGNETVSNFEGGLFIESPIGFSINNSIVENNQSIASEPLDTLTGTGFKNLVIESEISPNLDRIDLATTNFNDLFSFVSSICSSSSMLFPEEVFPSEATIPTEDILLGMSEI